MYDEETGSIPRKNKKAAFLKSWGFEEDHDLEQLRKRREERITIFDSDSDDDDEDSDDEFEDIDSDE